MPSKDKKRDLYLAASMAELQKKSEIKPQTTNARILVKSADTMFREAEKHDLQGDEEKAFIMYMRYFNIVKQVKTNSDYKKNKQYYDGLLGQKNQVRAIEQAEQLAASLKERYDFKEAEAVAQKFAALDASGKRKEKEAEEEKEKPADNKKESSMDENGSKDGPSTSASTDVPKPVIVPGTLCSLMRDANTQLVIMDARKTADFAESHLSHASCISVPQEVLNPGTTVSSIENQLPTESVSLWRQRGVVDHIILLDWSSKLESLVLSSPLRTLKDALFVYDSTVILKRDPLVLEGGYEQWLLFYPICCSMTPYIAVMCVAYDSTVILKSEPLVLEGGYEQWLLFYPICCSMTPYIAVMLQYDSIHCRYYDSTVILKSEPLVLEGGYEQWLLFYPTLTTNPRVSRPSPSSVSSSGSLLDFDYPDFEEPQKSKPEEASDHAVTKDHPPADNSSVQPPTPTNTTSTSTTTPQFNRALKPRAPAGQAIMDMIAKPGELNNTRHVNLARDSPPGEGVGKVTNHLYPTFVVGGPGKGEKNTNVEAEESIASEASSSKRAPAEDTASPSVSLPAAAAASESPEEVQARLKLKALEEKRKKEERALADIMRQKRHAEQDLKEMQTLAAQERHVRDAHDKAVKEEEAERKRQAGVERLRLERKKKEQETQREKTKERELREAEEKAEEEEEERLRAAQQHADKLRADKARQDSAAAAATATQKLQKEKEEQARLEADKRKALEEEKRRKEEEEKKEEEAVRLRKEEEERRKKKEAAAEERNRKVKTAEDEKSSQEMEKHSDGIRQAQEPKMIPSPSLPAGWEKRLDNPTRRYYYIDHNHSKTQWEPPAMTDQPHQRKDKYTTRLKEEPTISTRGGLSRSHSSPDIMKQLADEAKMTSKPVYDRTSKPSLSSLVPEVSKPPVQRLTARRRDLNPVYGNVGSALTGLRNLGNTCYMNSTVQCLNNTTPLVTYLLNDSYLNDINRDSAEGMHGEVVDELAVVSTVGKYNPMFAGYQQQDSQEFLTFLLDGLHEGLNEVKKRPQIPDQDNDRLPDTKAAALAWENHKLLHRSIIVELFQGQLKSTLTCRTCQKTSVTFQASMYISLPIPASNRCSLKDCLKAFLQPEMMTGSCKWKCPQCRMERDAEKKIDIWKLPHILLIGLNRFVSDGMWMQKKTTYVDFPVDQLDLEEFTLGPKNRSRYNLYGVSNHYGTMEGGHYTAFCRNPCNSRWHKFDDQEVYEMSKSDVKTSAAYVLYYTSIPLNAPQFKLQL
ncbi:hypothetical protein ACOMHN_050294 [Nucella lapillus]